MHFISVMLTLKGINNALTEFQKSVIFIKKCSFVPKIIKNLLFVINALFRLRNTKMKTASHSDHPLTGHSRFCTSYCGPFYCLMLFVLKNAALC